MNDDIDDLYRRAAARDESRPSDGARGAILAHAARLAAQRIRSPAAEVPPAAAPRPRRSLRTDWLATMFGALAVAGLAGLIVLPQFLGPHRDGHASTGLSVLQAQTEVSAPGAAAPPAVAKSAEPPAAANYSAAPRQGPPESRAADAASRGAERRAGKLDSTINRAPTADGASREEATIALSIDGQSRDAQGRTELLRATLRGDAKRVDELLARGADPNAADRYGLTPLRAALAAHQSEIAAALRRAGAR